MGLRTLVGDDRSRAHWRADCATDKDAQVLELFFGWRLAPAYDLNPSIEKDHLALNIDTENNALDIDLARSVGEYFHLNQVEQEVIIKEVKSACKKWRDVADELSISRADQEMMAAAFRLID